jgi:hypothetical protein
MGRGEINFCMSSGSPTESKKNAKSANMKRYIQVKMSKNGLYSAQDRLYSCLKTSKAVLIKSIRKYFLHIYMRVTSYVPRGLVGEKNF